MKGQNFILYNYFPNFLCGTSLNKGKISAYFPMLANKNFEVETCGIQCCEGNFCNRNDETKGTCNGHDVIKATSFVVVASNTLAWLFLA